MRRVRARLGDERGWGLVSSVLVVGILMSISLPLLSLVDAQQNQSAHERKSESSFNLAEAALDASMFVLGKEWPALATGAYPSTCTEASTSLRCPSPDLLTRTYTGGDYTNRAWTVQIRDDTGGDYYDPDVVPSLPSWDSNGNARVWVRADAHAAAGDRTIVALVRRIDRTEAFPRNAITAGWFTVATGGNKAVVDTKGNTAQAAPVAVRCTLPAPSPGCLDYRPDRDQVSPDTSTTGYGGSSALPPDSLDRFRAKAKALGSYYPSGCPQSPTGDLIFVEAGNCTYAGGGTANSAGAPGMFVLANGTLSFGGGITYYGLVYAANLQQSSDVVVTLFGGATVVGSIAVDGDGGVRAGSSGKNVIYADGIFPLITTFSAAAPVQGSWRELPAS
jgi:hypothetical protein